MYIYTIHFVLHLSSYACYTWFMEVTIEKENILISLILIGVRP